MMEIGGIDIVFQASAPDGTTLQERALKFFQHRWPEGVVESDETQGPVWLRDPAGWQSLKDAPELFFYPSREAEASWSENGACNDNLDQLIQVLVSPPDAATGEHEVTIVISERSLETPQIVDDLRGILQSHHR
jgi:hypothetical protein